MSKHLFFERFKVVLGQASPEDALAAGNYPASGSYVDVSGCTWAHVVVHMGAINAGDTPNLHVKCTDSVSGTLDSISATDLAKEVLATDDDQVHIWSIQVMALPTDHHFLSTVVADVTNGAYGEIIYFLEPCSFPITQSASVLPSDNEFKYYG